MLPPLLGLALAIAALVLAGRGRLGTLFALLAVLAGLLQTLSAPGAPWQLACLAGFPTLAFLAVIRIAATPEEWSIRRRLWQGVALGDIREAVPIPRTLDRRAILGVVGHGLLFAFGNLAIRHLAVPPDWSPLFRLLISAVMIFALLGLLSDLSTAVHRANGVEIPRMQHAPLRSRSLSEFWTHRWNRFVGGWLRRFVFRPLARRLGAASAVWGTFGVSALLHFWLGWAALDLSAGLRLGSYFLVAALLVAVEAQLGVAHWPHWAARTWTYAAILAPLPLAVEPFLRIFAT